MTALTDRDVLALTLYGEGRGEPVEGRIAIACTIQNRVQMDLRHDDKPDWWGEGYTGVCLATEQFSCWNQSDPNRKVLEALSSQLMLGHLAGDGVFLECQWIADGILGHRVQPRVGQATHYHAVGIEPPPWTAKATIVARIGRHVFYAHVP